MLDTQSSADFLIIFLYSKNMYNHSKLANCYNFQKEAVKSVNPLFDCRMSPVMYSAWQKMTFLFNVVYKLPALNSAF